MDRFDAIAAFVAVADKNGFSPAARALGVSPSAVTRLVAGLEDHLGVRLLQRTTRSVRLTDSGERFLERARRIMDDLGEAERIAEDERGVPTGRLAVSAPLMFGRLHIGPLVCHYMQLYPEVSVELQLVDRMVNLIDEGVDIALRIGHLTDSSLVARRMGATRRVVVGSPAYLRGRPPPVTPDDLNRHRIIASTATAPERRWRFARDREPFEQEVSPAYVTNSAEAAIWHAAHDGGLTQVLGYQVIDRVRAGALAVVLAEYESPAFPIHFVYPTSRLLSAKVRTLIDTATAEDWNFTAF